MQADTSSATASAPFVTPVNHNDEWATPWPLFQEWDDRFDFTRDAAASEANAKLDLFWDKDVDGLKASWKGERIWVNPPWSNVGPWVDKALEREASLSCLLLPARTDRPWFRKLHGSEFVYIRFLGRVAFIDPRDEGRTSPREGAMIAVVL